MLWGLYRPTEGALCLEWPTTRAEPIWQPREPLEPRRRPLGGAVLTSRVRTLARRV